MQLRQKPARFIRSIFCTSVRSRRCATSRRNAAASSSVRVFSSKSGTGIRVLPLSSWRTWRRRRGFAILIPRRKIGKRQDELGRCARAGGAKTNLRRGGGRRRSAQGAGGASAGQAQGRLHRGRRRQIRREDS